MSYVSFAAISGIRSGIHSRLRIRRGQKRLHRLSPDEQRILVTYLRNGGDNGMFHPMNGTAGRLVAEGILFRPLRLVNLRAPSPYSIQPWALDYLRRHPDLVGLRKAA
jgi:hypothetical protein